MFSVAPLRHAHYEVFLGAHQLCVITFLTGAWLHCYTDELPQITHVNIAIGIWIAERFHRVFTICRKNLRLGRNWSANTAEVSVVPAGEDAVRVSITMHKGWEFQPGQHAYLYIPRLSWTQSHPFSIAWSSTTESEVDDLKVFHPAQSSTAVIGEKLNDTQFEMRPTSFNAELYSTSPTSSSSEIRSTSSVAHRNLTVSNPRTTIHFVISRRGGFTNRLFEAAGNGTNHKYPEMAHIAPQRFLALVEGPYCNEVHNFDSFASLLFVAGGSGITHPLGYVRHLLSASANRLVAARRIKLVWVIRDRRNIFWINDWLEELWRLDAGRGIFEMEIYVTRPSSTSHRAVDLSGGTQVKWFPGRPQMEDILAGMITPSRMRNGRGALSVNGNTPVSSSP